MKNWLYFGGDLGLDEWAKHTLVVAACPDRGAGNDPEGLG